jgi:haloalkane dehalogenase
LLSSVCRPFGKPYGDGDGVSSEGSYQILWAQGVFRTRATTTQWGIDFIAANLKIPTTTLHYPTLEQFIAEIRKGYDYIGIAFVVPTFHKLLPMIAAIREHAPRAQIILGGYGTTLGEQLKPLCDHVCQGEGVAFMRRLLGEPIDAPIVQPDITQSQSLFSLPVLGQVGYVFAGLGCPNGCDFCATSHYYKQKHIKFLPDGPAILGAIRDLRKLHPAMTDFWICDEDFLLDEERGRGFLEAIRRSDLPPLALSIFGSVKALSRFTASELVEMGVDWIWIGYEGQRAGYAKMQGRPYRELFADLHRHGISVLASMIIGFDYQTPEIIQQEFEDLVSMRPTMSQFLIYGPARGTPGYARLVAEGRLPPEAARDTPRHDGFSSKFLHPTMRPEELEAIHRRLYREEFSRLGPAVFRVVDDYLAGYLHLRDHPDARIRGKAERYRQVAHRSMMLMPASLRHLAAPSADWVGELLRRLGQETGPMTLKERLLARLAGGLIRYTQFKLRHDLGQQPDFSRRLYRMPGPLQALASVRDVPVSLPEA